MDTFWKNLIIIGCIIAFLGGIYYFSGEKKEKEAWKGFYYPEGCLSCEDDWIFSPDLNSFEACVEWATSIQYNRKNSFDTWECGLNCEWSDRWFSEVCEETKGTPGTSFFN